MPVQELQNPHENFFAFDVVFKLTFGPHEGLILI